MTSERSDFLTMFIDCLQSWSYRRSLDAGGRARGFCVRYSFSADPHPLGKVIPMEDSDFAISCIDSRTALRPAEQVISHVEMFRPDNPGDDGKDSLTSFIHSGIVYLSPYVRHPV